MKPPQKILVTGATGYIGGRLVTALIKEGYQVVAMARDPAKLERRRPDWGDAVSIVRADVFDPDSLEAALHGVDAAYYLIHSMRAYGREFHQRDQLAGENFARACEAQSVGRIIYLGGLAGSDPEASPHLKSRRMTGEALRSTSVPLTELRAAVIVGSGSASFEMIRDLITRLPVMLVPRWAESRCEPIGIRQVLAYLVGCLTEPRTIDGVFEIGGGDVVTYRQMIEQGAEVMGKKPLIVGVPVLTPKLSSYWLNMVTSVPMAVARPLVEGLRTDVVCTDHRIRRWIRAPKMSYQETVALALYRETSGTRETTAILHLTARDRIGGVSISGSGALGKLFQCLRR